jgi:hypothetical protein
MNLAVTFQVQAPKSILIQFRTGKETFRAKEAVRRALLAKADIRVDYGVEVSVTEWTHFL